MGLMFRHCCLNGWPRRHDYRIQGLRPAVARRKSLKSTSYLLSTMITIATRQSIAGRAWAGLILVCLMLSLGLAAYSSSVPADGSPLAMVSGGRPQGLFFMMRYWVDTQSLEKAAYFFTPAGQVFVNPAGFSAAELGALPAGSRGTYCVAGS